MNQYKQKLKRAAQNISLAIMFGISCLITAHAADFSITVKTKTINGDQYNNVATKSITGDHWELISGHYKHSNDKDLASPYLYIEGPNKGINYYIDSLVVVDLNSELSGSAENLTDNSGLETGSVSPWFKNGDIKLALENAIVNDGKYSLKVSQRTDNWNGAAIAFNRALISGHTYKISAWVKLAKSEATVKTVQKSNPSSVNSNYVYFTDGKPTGEWGIVLGDSSDWTKGIKNNTGSSADKQLAVKPATYKVANDAINIKWARKKGKGQFAIYGANIDLSSLQDSVALTMEVKVIRKPKKSVQFGLDCGYPCRGEMNIQKMFRGLPKGEWVTFPIPLNCFVAQGLDASRINGPLLIASDGSFEIEIADVRMEQLPEGAPTCAN